MKFNHIEDNSQKSDIKSQVTNEIGSEYYLESLFGEGSLEEINLSSADDNGIVNDNNKIPNNNVVHKRIIGGGSLSVNPTRICVMGVGGGGVNATNMMVKQKIHGVDIVAANTDAQTLNSCLADIALPLGHTLSGGLGAGGNPLKGAEAAREARKDIYEWVKQYDMLFLAAGLGGGTGTGATSVIAEIAKEAGVLTLAVVTLPFDYEGSQRISIAAAGLEELEAVIDALLVIPNDNIMQNDFTSHDIGVEEGFKVVDMVLADTVRSITEIITVPSLMNIDFADIKSCLVGSGRIAVGFGSAVSEDRKNGNAHRAVEAALKNTIISQENIEIMKQANHIIASTVAGPEVSINDYTAISDLIASRVNPGGNHAFKHGYRVEPTWGKRVQVTIIAAKKESLHEIKRFDKHSSLYGQSHTVHRPLEYAGSMHQGESTGVAREHQKEVIRVNSDYVKNDIFEKLLEKNEFVSTEHDILDQNLYEERRSTPAVNRLLGLTDEQTADSKTKEHSELLVDDKPPYKQA